MALWTPANLATPPLAWFDPSDSSTLTLNGSTIAAIANKGSLGGNAAQGTAANQPGYSATGWTASSPAMPCFTFAGANRYLALSPTIPNPESGGLTVRGMAVFNGSSTPSILGGIAGGPDFYHSTTKLELDKAGSANILTTGAITSVAHLYGYDTASTGSNINVDGTALVTSTVDPAYTTGIINLFANRNNVSALNAPNGEIVVCNSLSQSDAQTLEGYLAWKWGTNANLPTSHPYYSAAPTTGTSATLSGDPGSFAVTGQSATLASVGILSAAPGSFAVSGQIAGVAQSSPSAPVTVFLSAGTTSWPVPAGVAFVQVECIGPGGNGGISASGAGGGGAYAKKAMLSVAAGTSIPCQIGAAGSGNATWFNSTSTVLAAAGTSGTSSAAGMGGASASSVGDTVNAGGNGGVGSSLGRGGGGGGGGPQGNGATGGAGGGGGGVTGGGGGGANGGTAGAAATASVAGIGGSGPAGAVGGAAGVSSHHAGYSGVAGSGGGGGYGNDSAGGSGSHNAEWDNTHGVGSGGGGGGYSTGTGGSAGGYGGGGGGGATAGSGSGGLIVLTYVVAGSALAASPGSFLITGQPATFNTQAPGGLAASPGSFAVSGKAAAFSGFLGAQLASFAISGKPAAFVQATALAGALGSFAVNGQPAIFSFVGTVTLPAQPGAFSISGGSATFSNMLPIQLAGTFTARIAATFRSQIVGVFQ